MTRDERSVAAVLDAAAERTGKPREPVVAVTLTEQGVDWAWQLEQLSDSDWDRLGATLGLKTAAKAELTDPTVISSAKPVAGPTEASLDDERIRRFLLLPGADGKEAKPLGQVSAMFLGLLATPIAERQTLMLALCELMALVSGLFLAIPFEFRRHALTEPSSPKGWDVPPTLADGMNAMVLFTFLVNTAVAFFSVSMAMAMASGGFHADEAFCWSTMVIMGALFTFFAFGAWMSLIVLCVWQLLTDAASPYPIIGCLVLFAMIFQTISICMVKFMAENMALEIYHQPRWAKANVKMNFPWLKHMFTDKVLRPKAERRAAKLRAQMGFAAPVESGSSVCVVASPVSA